MPAKPVGSSPGPSTDATNTPVVDPTENVKELNKAAAQRQDDLREVANRRLDEAVFHLKELQQVRAEHAKEIRQLEADRLEKIRQVDVAAVKTEADRALAAIQALALTTAANAETLRTALQNTAQAIAKQNSDTVGQLIERIAALEKSSYEGVGKSQYTNPQLAALEASVRGLQTASSDITGVRRGADRSWQLLLGAAGLILTLLSIAGILFAVLKK